MACTVSMLFSVDSFAVSECKGLASSACDESTSCRWVDSYQRKDGRKVNAFCRSYSAKKNISKSSSDRQKSTAVVSSKAVAKTLSSNKTVSKK